MKSFQIISSAGVEMGIYRAISKGEALEMMALDAGYNSYDAAETVAKFEGTIKELPPIEVVVGDVCYTATIGAPKQVDGLPVVRVYRDGVLQGRGEWADDGTGSGHITHIDMPDHIVDALNGASGAWSTSLG